MTPEKYFSCRHQKRPDTFFIKNEVSAPEIYWFRFRMVKRFVGVT